MSLVGFSAKNHPQQVGKAGARDVVDDRETPREIFEPLHAEHRFNLDVAASRENAKTTAFLSIERDALSVEQWWSGRVWCNPPYSNIEPWVEKAWHSMMAGRTEVVVMLLPANRTEQGWWQKHVEPWRDRKSRNGVRLSVRFLPGRPRFFRPSGKVGGPRGDRPPFGCCVLVFKSAGDARDEAPVSSGSPGRLERGSA